MKDDIAGLVAMRDTFDDILARIGDWMDYYYNDRGQWDLLKLAPKEYCENRQTEIFPLPVFIAVSSPGSAPDPEVQRFQHERAAHPLRKKERHFCAALPP